MSSKVNFNSGRMIVVRLLAAFLILLAGTTQASAQRRFRTYIVGKFDNAQTQAIQQYLKGKVLAYLLKHYPCANYMDDTGLAAMLKFERDRQLLGKGDEESLSDLAGALGAQYLVSINVTQISNTFVMNVIGADKRRGTTISRKAATAQGFKEAYAPAESLAEEFASDMIKSLPDCYENEWIGTITYQRVTQGESRTTEDHLVYKGTKTTEITSKATTDAEFEVRGIKKPARVFVKCFEDRVINIVTNVTVTCPGPTLFEQGKTVSWNTTDVDEVTGKAEGKVDEAMASVSVDGDEFTISCTVPQIEGGTSIRDQSLKDSGGCGEPVNQHESTSISWTTSEEYGQANGKIDPAKPDVLAGSKTIKVPSPTGIQETKIISWDLRFIRSASAERIK